MKYVKIRYLLPLLYILLFLLCFVAPPLFGFFVIVSAPVNLPMIFLGPLLGLPRDTFYLDMGIEVVLLFAVGGVVDIVFRWLKNRPMTGDSPSKIAEIKKTL